MKIQEIVQYLDGVTHPEYQENYDNSGFLVGDPNHDCAGVLIALDLTPEVVDEAIEKNANLIVTHHPAIFGGLKRITPSNATGQLVISLIRRNLSLYAAHTNLDNLKEGVNGILADRLGLRDCAILRPIAAANMQDVGAGMVGVLPRRMPILQFFSLVKERLGLPLLRTSQPVGDSVFRVAICGGAGAFLIDDANAAGADVYLTGDLKYHDFQHATGFLTLADIGHYESEQLCKELIYSFISKKFSNFACFISERGKSFIHYV